MAFRYRLSFFCPKNNKPKALRRKRNRTDDLFSFRPKITVAHQVFPTGNREGIAVGYHKEIITNRGDGIIIMVRNDDSMIRASKGDEFLDRIYMDRVYL